MDIDRKHPFPFGKAELAVLLGIGDPGVVDQQFDRPECRAHLGDHLLDFCLLRHVGLDGHALGAARLDLRQDLLRGLGVVLVVDGDLGSVFGQHPDDGAANAATAARYQGGAPGKYRGGHVRWLSLLGRDFDDSAKRGREQSRPLCLERPAKIAEQRRLTVRP